MSIPPIADLLETSFPFLVIVVLKSEQLSINSSLYPAIPLNDEQGMTSTRSQIEAFLIPGNGKALIWDQVKYPGAECGKTKYTIKCDDKHDCDYPVELIPWCCNRYECPICYPAAVKQGAVGIREHVWNTLLEMKKAFHRTKWIVSSVIISAPQEFYDLDFDKLHYYFRGSLKHLGTKNVASIFHMWRYRDKTTGEEMEKVPWNLYKANPGNYQKIVAPHWHCFVIGKMVDSPIYHQKSGGWIYKKMKSDTTESYRLTKKDVYNIAYYALTHAAISTTRRRHAIRYYGMFWRLTITEKRVDYEEIICPKCEHQRVQRQEFHDWLCGVDTWGLETPAVKMIVNRTYALRGIEYGDLDDGLDFQGYYAPIKEVDYVDLSDL